MKHKQLKVSLLIPTYKDDEALKLILDALQLQTYKNFEIIVAEDSETTATKRLLEAYTSLYKIIHLSHEDRGNRKAIIMNKALNVANGSYIIFIDGDTLPYSTFIESHIQLSMKKTVLCGRRVNLGDKVSDDLRKAKISVVDIEKRYIRLYKYLSNDNLRHYEQGLKIAANSLVYRIIRYFNKNVHIVASNFSCYKEDIYAINGFDENLPYAPHRDDTDTEWRFIANGCSMKSCKYCANLLHLNHARNDRISEEMENLKLIQHKQNRNYFIAKNGIRKL